MRKSLCWCNLGDEGEEEVGRKGKIHFKSRKEKTERKRGRN